MIPIKFFNSKGYIKFCTKTFEFKEIQISGSSPQRPLKYS